MLPDYIIYDELKKEREKRERRRERPRLEIPRHRSYEPEADEEKNEEGEESNDRGVAIIQL